MAQRSGHLASLLGVALAAVAGSQAMAQSRSFERPVIVPGVRTAATWSDNVLLAPSGREESDWLLEVTPYVTAVSNVPRANYNVRYELRNLWRIGAGDNALARHALNGRGSFALVDDRLWLDVAGFMGEVTDSVTGPIAADPGGSLVNTSSLRRFSVSPWYRDRIGNFASYLLRYTAAHTGGDAGVAIAKLDQRVSASVDGLDQRSSTGNWRWYGDFQRRDFENDITRDRSASGLEIFFRVAPSLRVSGKLDYEQIDEVRNEDGEDSGIGPGLGFEWTPNSRLTVNGSASKRYYGTISEARGTYSTGASTMGLQYSRSILTSSDASLLFYDPAAIASGELGMTTTGSVMAALISSGLIPPVGTSLTQTLITDAAVRDRRVLAFYGLRGVRNALTLSGWLSRRESAIELSSGTSTAGELREHGLSVGFQHRLDPRSSVDFTVSWRVTETPEIDFETRLTAFRVGYLRQLTANTRAFVGYRRAEQSGEGLSGRYVENAVFGGVDMTFQ